MILGCFEYEYEYETELKMWVMTSPAERTCLKNHPRLHYFDTDIHFFQRYTIKASSARTKT